MYDDLKDPFIVTPGWKYICFTDQDFKSDVWEVVKVPVKDFGPAKTARYYKIMFHEHIEDEYSIWVDGTFFINCDLNEWWKQFKAPFTTIFHPFDRCVYKDIQSCMRAKKGNSMQLRDQENFYRQSGVPYNNGLIASGILMRQKSQSTIDFCKLWWSEVKRWTQRDQIAFGYANYKMPNSHQSISWDYTYMKEFIHVPHLHKGHWRNVRKQRIIEEYAGNKK